MYNGNKILGLIPARGGSKGIARKNIIDVGGKPLIAWTIDEAAKSKYIDRLIVSSEDREIIETAVKYGCEAPFVRPAALALDETPGIDPVIHAIETVAGYDYVVLLQPTSPLRLAEDIDCCIEACFEASADSSVSVAPVAEHPYLMFKTLAGGRLSPLYNEKPIRRQDLPAFYILNGAVYVARCDWLKKSRSFTGGNTVAYIMPRERSLDLDTKHDLMILNAVINSMSR